MEPKEGGRVKAIRFSTTGSSVDDNVTVPPGTEGTILSLSEPVSTIHQGQIWVRWENGVRLALLVGLDEFEVLS